MADTTLVQSGSSNGTATPATPGSLTTTAGNLLILVVTALGTSPTSATPAGFSLVQRFNGATISFNVYMQANNPGGATNPSSTLGGTVTGWVASLFEFSQTGANCGLQGSALQTSAGGTVATNKFPTAGLTLSNELFIYAIGRATATFAPTPSSPTVLSAWSASVQPQAGVQGLSTDFYWMSGLGNGVNNYPSFAGTLGASVTFAACAAWFNTLASQPGPNGDNIGGQAGILVPQYYQGMVGG